MRILHVVATANFAGVERYVASVTCALAERGHELVVVGGDPNRMPHAAGKDVHWRPGASASRAFHSIVASGRVDIVHAHMTAAEAAGLAASPLARGKLVATRHFARARGSTAAARAFSRLFNSRADLQIAVSQYVADEVESAPTAVVHSGVPFNRGPYDLANRVVLVVQRLEPEKQTDVALRIWQLSSAASFGWTLRILGDGSQRSRLEALACELGIRDSVTFAGWSDSVTEELAAAGLVIATTPVEAFGFTVVEAMAAGVPPLAVAAGGHLETVGAATGSLLFPADAERVAASRLRELLTHDQARSSLSRLVRAYQREHLSLNKHVDRLEALYRLIAST